MRASAASLPPWMAVVLHSSDVFVIAKTRHQQMYTDVYLLMRYLPRLFAKGFLPHTAVTSYKENTKLFLLFFIKIYRVFIMLFPILPSLRRYAVCKPIVFFIPFPHKKKICYVDIRKWYRLLPIYLVYCIKPLPYFFLYFTRKKNFLNFCTCP